MTYEIAQRIERIAETIGFTTTDCIAQSGSSSSCYVSLALVLSTGDGEPDDIGDTIRIRISDHVARPTYEIMHGVADYEVGNHDMASGDWMDCIEWLANKSGYPVPAIVAKTRKSMATRQAKQDAKMAQMLAAHKQARVERAQEAIKSGRATASRSRSGQTWFVNFDGIRESVIIPENTTFSQEAVFAQGLAGQLQY